MSEAIKEIQRATQREWQKGGAGYPNAPDAYEYRKVAEQLGFTVQTIAESADTTGAYYEVHAVYGRAVERIFGHQPEAVIFEDYSRSVPSTWICEPA